MAQQMPSLIVQHTVRDKPELMPVAISLNLFFQYLGATIMQALGGIVFRSVLYPELADHAGLNSEQIALLSAGGMADVRDTVEEHFPDLLRLVLEAYNTAITSTFVCWPSLTAIVVAVRLTDMVTIVCRCRYYSYGVLPCFWRKVGENYRQTNSRCGGCRYGT